MNPVEFWLALDHTLKTVMLGSLILGVTAGCLGTFAVLRQQSLLGDAISHATLPGVALAILIFQTKNPFVLLIGAGVAGWIGTLLVMLITHTTFIKRDAALGIVLSVFFGFGLVLLTVIQKMPLASQAGIHKFLFGNAATLLTQDVQTMAVFSAVALLCLVLFWKEFKVLVFDRDFAQGIGFPTRFLEVFLTTLIVFAIIIGLQTVGVVLMSAMLVAPAAAARQWTDRLGVMVMLASFFGAVAGVLGALTSSMVPNLPTGPTTVLYISLIVFFSLVLAPNRGLLWDYLRSRNQRAHIQATTILKDFFLLAQSHTDPFYPHDAAALKAIGHGTLKNTMSELVKRGWVRPFEKNKWALTESGLHAARKITETNGYDDSSN